MHNIDMDSIIEYAIEKVKAEIFGMRGSKVKSIDIDDISYNDNSISFKVIGYNAAAKSISEDYFTCSINFEDAPAENEDDMKWLIDNNVPEFAYNFVKNPVRPTFNESKSMTADEVAEAYDFDDERKDGTSDDLASKLADFADDFKYEGKEVFDWEYTRARFVMSGDVSLQLKLGSTFLGDFSDEQKSRMDKELDAFVSALKAEGYVIKGSPKVSDRFFLISNGWGRTGRYVTLRIENTPLHSNKSEMKSKLSTNEEEKVALKENYVDIDSIRQIVDEEFPHAHEELGQASLEDYVEYFYDLLSPDYVELLCNQACVPVASFETVIEDYYNSYMNESLTTGRVALKEEFEGSLRQVIDFIHETFGGYMSSLGMKDADTIYFECDEEFDSEDGLDFEDFQYDVRHEFENQFDVKFELEDANTALIRIVTPDWDDDDKFEWFVEQEIDHEGRCKYCALSGKLPNVKLLWVSQEWMDGDIATQICKCASEWLLNTAGKDIHVDAVMYCRDTPEEEYTASFTVGQNIEVTKPMAQPNEDEVVERVRNYLEHQPHPYKNTDPDDAEDVCEELSEYLFGISYDELEASYALYNTVCSYLEDRAGDDLEENLGKTIGVALFCTASVEVCTVGGVDEDGEDVEEPTIFDDKTPVNDILKAVDPDTDAGDAKCAEINQLLNAMPDGYIQVQAYCRGRDMGDRQVYDAYELYDEIRDIFNLNESLTESNNAYTYRGYYIINDGSTWMIKDGNNQVVRSGISTDAEAEEIIDNLDESVDYNDEFIPDDDM